MEHREGESNGQEGAMLHQPEGLKSEDMGWKYNEEKVRAQDELARTEQVVREKEVKVAELT